MDQSITFIIKKLTAGTTSDPNRYSSTFSYNPMIADERLSYGALFSLIELTNRTTEELDLSKLASSVFAYQQDQYYDDNNGGPLESIEIATRSSVNHANLLSQNHADVKMSAYSIWGQSLQYTNPNVLPLSIRRNHETFELDQPLNGTELIKNDDLVCIATTNFYELILKQFNRDNQELDNTEYIKKLEAYVSQPIFNDKDTMHSLVVHIAIQQVPGEEEIIEIKYPEELTHKIKSTAKTSHTSFIPKLLTSIGALTKRLANRDLYVKRAVPSSKHGQLAIVGVILLILGVSIGVTLVLKNRETQTQDISSAINGIKNTLARAEDLSQINPEEALELFNSAASQLGEVKGIRIDSTAATTVNEIENTLSTVRKLIYKDKPVELNPATINSPETPFFVEVKTDGVFDPQNDRLFGTAPEWQTVVSAATYNKNIYLLDPTAQNIWKYVTSGSEYSSAGTYIKDSTDITGAIDIAIDGSIYVLFTDRIDKFTLGEKSTFIVRGIFPTIDTNSKIATSPASEYIYISTPNGIAVINKNGNYTNTLTNEKLTSIEKIYLSEDGKILWVLAGGAWWSINLVPA